MSLYYKQKNKLENNAKLSTSYIGTSVGPSPIKTKLTTSVSRTSLIKKIIRLYSR